MVFYSEVPAYYHISFVWISNEDQRIIDAVDLHHEDQWRLKSFAYYKNWPSKLLTNITVFPWPLSDVSECSNGFRYNVIMFVLFLFFIISANNTFWGFNVTVYRSTSLTLANFIRTHIQDSFKINESILPKSPYRNLRLFKTDKSI